jgi:YtkA-like
MRVRPFFWILLIVVCLGVLTLAATVHVLAPARLSVQLTQRPTPETPTTLLVQVTDQEGLAVDGAQISSQAWMTNMHMDSETPSTTPQGQGTYLVQISFSMAGPWMVSVSMRADGFVPLHQVLFVQVPPESALASAAGTVRPDPRCSS